MYHGPAKYPALTGLKRDVCLCEDAEWRNDSACTEWEAWCPDTSILCYIDLIPLGRPVFWLGCLSTVLWEREPGYLRKCGYFAQLKSGGKSLKWSLPLRTGEKRAWSIQREKAVREDRKSKGKRANMWPISFHTDLNLTVEQSVVYLFLVKRLCKMSTE